MRTLVLAFFLAACAGGGAAPRPSVAAESKGPPLEGIAARASAQTRLLVSIDATRDEGRQFVEGFFESLPPGCDRDVEKVTRVEIAGDDRGRFVVEVSGALELADVACWTDDEVGVDGTLSIGELDLVARARAEGGVELAFGGELASGGAPTFLPRFLELRAGAVLAAVADVGPRSRPVVVELGHDGYVVGFADEVTAIAVEAELRRVAAALATRDPALAPLRVRRDGARLRLEGVTGKAAFAMPWATSALVESFRIPSASMVPTLELGDNVTILKGELMGDVRRGDVVVLSKNGKDYAKRIIAVGGDTVTIQAGNVTVAGALLPQHVVERDRVLLGLDPMEGWIENRGAIADETLDGRTYRVVVDDRGGMQDGTWTVPAGQVFVLGDNRPNSLDSRVFGPVPRADIKGRIAIVFYSSGRDGVRWDRILTAVE